MATVDDLYNIAVGFLDAATEALQATEVGPPGRRYVADGQPALDCCGQLTVWAQTLRDFDTFAGQGGLASLHRAPRIGTKPGATIFVQVTRCILYKPVDLTDPKGKLPDPALIQETARMVDQDGWAMRQGMDRALREGELAEFCKGYEALGGEKLTPQGGCVGWTFQYVYPLEPGRLGT